MVFIARGWSPDSKLWFEFGYMPLSFCAILNDVIVYLSVSMDPVANKSVTELSEFLQSKGFTGDVVRKLAGM